MKYLFLTSMLICASLLSFQSSFAQNCYQAWDKVQEANRDNILPAQKIVLLQEAVALCPKSPRYHMLLAEEIIIQSPYESRDHFLQAACWSSGRDESFLTVSFAGAGRASAQLGNYRSAAAFMEKAVNAAQIVINNATTDRLKDKTVYFRSNLGVYNMHLNKYQIAAADAPVESSDLEPLFGFNKVCRKRGGAIRAQFARVKTDVHILFEHDKAQLTSVGREGIKELGKALRKVENEAMITLTGHTDKTGSEEYNDQLSIARAETVKTYLIEEFPQYRGRITATGRGEQYPLFLEDTPEAYQRNRRVEVRIGP